MSGILSVMNALDILIAGALILSVVVSLLRGGIREFASLLALVAGFYLAATFYGLASVQIFRITSHQEVNDTISFLVIFLFIAALVSYAGGQITEIVNKSKLRGWNTMFGFIFGLTRGVLIACFVVYALLVMLPHDSRTFTRSKIFPYAVAVTEVISPIGPDSFQEDFNNKLDKFRKAAAKKAGLPEAAVPAVELPIEPRAANAKKEHPAFEDETGFTSEHGAEENALENKSSVTKEEASQ